MKQKHHGIQGPVLSANTEGLTNGLGAPVPPKVFVTGWGKRIQLCSLNLANQFNGGLVEVACVDSYSLGVIAGVYVRTRAILINMSKKISRDGPAANWVWTRSGDALNIELGVEEFRFAHIGVGTNEDISGFFAQSLHNTSRPTLLSVVLFPQNCDYSIGDSIGRRMAMYERVSSKTVMPPPTERGSLWWNRQIPWGQAGLGVA